MQNSLLRIFLMLSTLVLVHQPAVLHTLAQSTTAAQFNRGAWLADYAALKAELERSYSHLAWFGSPQSGVDLPALDRAISEALDHSHSDAEASAAITRFVASFHDGHFAPTAIQRPAPRTAPEPPAPVSFSDARTACAALGYVPVTRVAFSMPFESLEGFELLSDGFTDPFRAGVIKHDGRLIGIVRIPRFRPAEFPAVCERAWASLRGRGVEPTRAAILEVIDAEWLRMLATRLTQLQTRSVTVLLIDVGGNGGGNDLGDWAVRLFTRAPVRSAPLLLSASRVALPYFDEQLGDLERALKSNANLPQATKAALERAIAEFSKRKQEASAPCDMSWVWREQRKWGTSPCTHLIPSGFASGAVDYAEPGSFDSRAARALYWPAIADSLRGAWNGPTYVLTDANTGSAAEMFVSLIRDRGIGKIIGTHTFGLGCGFIDYDAPFVLPNSARAFRIPNCVRLRSDGTDEVAGIAPDLPLTSLPGESTRSLAARALRILVNDLSPSNSR